MDGIDISEVFGRWPAQAMERNGNTWWENRQRQDAVITERPASGHLHLSVRDDPRKRWQPHPSGGALLYLSFFPRSSQTKKNQKKQNRKLTISSCSCLCSVELSFSCCLPYICMISTTILSLSSSSTTAAFVSLATTSVTGDNNGAGGGGRGGGGEVVVDAVV